MSKKSPKIAALIADCAGDPHYDPHYLGYFKCFNQQLYYEAHDVLEELWLIDRKRPEANFYKGLIQFAGAFVHLKKNRLEPAFRLFLLAEANFAQYSSPMEGVDLLALRERGNQWRHLLKANGFQINPWSEMVPVVLSLPNEANRR